MTNLQNIVFPKNEICDELWMYFRTQNLNFFTNFDVQNRFCMFQKGESMLFDTYFNSFSIGKWVKYTKINNLFLCLDIKGSFQIKLLYSYLVNNVKKDIILKTINIDSASRLSKEIPFPLCEDLTFGMISFSITSMEDNSTLFSGFYGTQLDENKINNINLALNICTFKREDYVYRTIDNIKQYIYANNNSPLKDHLSIYIVDNGQSIDKNKIEHNKIHLYKQGDFGSSGGYTRGLIEILRNKKECNTTHVIMMDDDAIPDTECFERNYNFLKVLKPEYKNAFIGGALLRLDYQNVTVINGGGWNTKDCYEFHKIGLDMNNPHDVLLSELEDDASINGWWYHCIPISVINENDLPFPFFFHMDDVEYDLRNCKQLILLNGICVWHEPFENKPASHLAYYNTRNVIATHLKYYPKWNKRKCKKFILNGIKVYIQYYRYKEAMLELDAVEDVFLRFEKVITHEKPDLFLEEILSKGYKKLPVEQLPMPFDYEEYLSNLNISPESKLHKLFRKITLYGYLIPAKKDSIVPMFGPQLHTTFRARNVLNYDPITQRGYMTKKSYSDCLKVLFRWFKISILINLKFKKMRGGVQQYWKDYTKAELWRRLLRCKEL